jgi:uncharacterized membrane protein (DUF2068 family)
MHIDADDDRTLVLTRAQLGLEIKPTPERDSDVSTGPDKGVRVIIAYKFVRALVGIVLGTLLATTLALGHGDSVQKLALHLQHHVSSRFGTALATKLLDVLVPHRMWLIAGALGIDGLLTGVEAWALSRGRRWGEWLVAVLTGSLVPFEAVGLWRDPQVGRTVLLVGNVLAAAYLLRVVLREQPRVG